jgi:hypothetical protein
MEFRRNVEVPPATLLAVSELLRKLGSKMSIEEAATAAIEQWLAANGAPQSLASPALRGYQWKEVFLPDGTDVRMTYGTQTCYARVVGDDLVHEGRPMSPRHFTQWVAPGVRNAWRDLWLRFPGTRDWKRAYAVRRELAQSPPQSPAATINAAAACMSDALKTALALVEQTRPRPVQRDERRLEQPRRSSDVLADHCSFD